MENRNRQVTIFLSKCTILIMSLFIWKGKLAIMNYTERDSNSNSHALETDTTANEFYYVQKAVKAILGEFFLLLMASSNYFMPSRSQ